MHYQNEKKGRKDESHVKEEEEKNIVFFVFSLSVLLYVRVNRNIPRKWKKKKTVRNDATYKRSYNPIHTWF